MIDVVKQSLHGQFAAAIGMLEECLRKCPPAQWNEPIAKYPFWMVAYHTLCYIDVYLSVNNDAWQPRQDGSRGGLHPKGREELEEEYPSRSFQQGELLEYVAICRVKAASTIAAESPSTLAGPSGFSHLKFTRLEAHVYNIRHIQHHAGQLGAFLRRAGVDTRWLKSSDPPAR